MYIICSFKRDKYSAIQAKKKRGGGGFLAFGKRHTTLACYLFRLFPDISVPHHVVIPKCTCVNGLIASEIYSQ